MAVDITGVMKRDNRTNDKAKRRKERCVDCCHSNLSDMKGKNVFCQKFLMYEEKAIYRYCAEYKPR
ncbi:unnamed protein product [marine sediment metagenome]|uniref:Uncharacterized protein n=1 Tax=marine sediment metagenome TaxID=412755 RepID=X1PQK9_9ZZZZ